MVTGAKALPRFHLFLPSHLGFCDRVEYLAKTLPQSSGHSC